MSGNAFNAAVARPTFSQDAAPRAYIDVDDGPFRSRQFDGDGVVAIEAPQKGTVDTIPGNNSSTFTLAIGGVQTGVINPTGDDDWFRVELVAGESYVFTMTGSGATPLEDTYLELYNGSGILIALDDDAGPGTDSMLRFTATTSGTYFLNARAWEADEPVPGYTGQGDYTVTANLGAPQSPLDTIDSNFAVATSNISVYFAGAGEAYQGFTAIRAWAANEITAAMTALGAYSSVVNLNFTQTFSAAGATFILTLADLEDNVLGMFAGSSTVGYGFFAPDATGWTAAGLLPGGLGYTTLIHEFGHGLGLSHPHDNGGNSEVMQGVISPFNSYGDFEMNQGVFTTMSYNDGFRLTGGGGVNTGNQFTPGPLDIAVLQEKYGANATANSGNTTYELTTALNGYRAIWDVSGTDAIVYNGASNTTIDLRGPTLANEIGGGGYVSYIEGQRVGFTIAAGAVIENATGGSGRDTITGNSANNTLTGNGDTDNLFGMDGDDVLLGGAGNDALYGGGGADTMTGGTGDDGYFIDALDIYIELPGEGSDSIVVGHGVSFTLPEHFENLTLLSGVLEGIGNAARNQIVGNDAGNRLDGGAGADWLTGGNGDDVIIVDDPLDFVIGLGGYDIVESTALEFAPYSGIEEIRLLGPALDASNSVGPSAIKIVGNGNDNALSGSWGDDLLQGGDGADYLFGSDGDDVLEGGAGDDTLFGQLGADTKDGGAGTDTATYHFSGSAIILDLANSALNGGYAAGEVLISIENVVGTDHNDQIAGDSAANWLRGEWGDDVLDGRAANDVLDGGAGDDVLHGGAGADALNGGDGVDTADYSSSTARVVVRLSTGFGESAHAQGDTLSGIENLTGSAFNDALIGSAGANALSGGLGNDYLDGGAANDVLDGGEGDDRLVGGLGADQLIGGAGVDLADYSTGTGRVVIRLWNGTGESGAAQGDTLSGIENVTGTSANDALIGGATANVLRGGAGNDYLDGLEGDDILIGGAGADNMVGGIGVDTVSYEDATARVVIRLSNQTAVEGEAAGDIISGFENATGGAGNDALIGDGFANTLDGRGGNDYLDGGLGNDILIGGAGDDRLVGGLGADQMNGGDGIDLADYSSATARVVVRLSTGLGESGHAQGDTLANIENLTGSNFNDALIGANTIANVLRGGGGDDYLDGLSGNDYLDGGAGADRLNGGLGADTFAFVAGQGQGDQVLDFASGQDQLRFEGYGSGATLTQLDATHWRVASADGLTADVITIANAAALNPGDWLFV